jgi:DNA replication and repair protein RecF
VLFTADDLGIISGGPASRRAYLDSALSQLYPGYYGALQRYGRIMQQRNASLRRLREGLANLEELALWDESFTREGAVLIAARQRAIQDLGALSSAAQDELSGPTANEELQLSYAPALGEEWRRVLPPQTDAAAVQPIFAAALASQRRRELAAGVSLVGPHRDDLTVTLNGAAAAAYGSRAQIRTAALALRLAEARLLTGEDGEPPVLLLDDIVSELDERRRRSVLEGVSGFEQVWFTATTGAWLPADFVEGASSYRISAGSIELA